MKQLLIIFLFLSSINFHAQSFIVVDSKTNESLPFVAITYGEKGMYSNEFGKFEFKEQPQDSLEFYLLGYQKLKLAADNIKDTVYMQEYAESLGEVRISVAALKPMSLKALKKANNFGSWILSHGHSILIFIKPNEEIADAYLEKLYFPFEKIREESDAKDELRQLEAFVRINIFETVGEHPGKQLYASEPLRLSAYDNDEVELQLANETLRLNGEGMFISMEFLGYYDQYGNLQEQNNYLRPVLTSKTSRFYDAETYLKYSIASEARTEAISNVLEKGGMSGGQPLIRNLAVGLELSK